MQIGDVFFHDGSVYRVERVNNLSRAFFAIEWRSLKTREFFAEDPGVQNLFSPGMIWYRLPVKSPKGCGRPVSLKRLVNRFMKDLLPGVDWVPLDFSRTGGQIFLNPKPVGIEPPQAKEVLTLTYLSGMTSRVNIPYGIKTLVEARKEQEEASRKKAALESLGVSHYFEDT